MNRSAPALLLLLAACSDDPGHREAGREAAVHTDPGDAMPSVSDLKGAPLALGSWSFRQMDGQAAALFGPPGGEPLFAIRCDEQLGQVHFVRSGLRSDESGAMRLVTAHASETLSVRPVPTQIRNLEAALPAGAPFIAGVLAADIERLGVQLDQGPMLVMPGDPTIGRAVGRCVRG